MDVPRTRAYEDINLLVINARHSKLLEEIIFDACVYYLSEKIAEFSSSTFLVVFGLLGYFMISNLSFLYYQVVSRIKTLTHHIMYPDDEEIQKYIHEIKKREFDY